MQATTGIIVFLLGAFIGLAGGWYFGYYAGEVHVVNCLKTLGLGC